MHRNREEYPGELAQREIDLACSLKDKKASIFTLLIFFIVSNYINVFLYLFILIYLFIDLSMMQLIHHKAMWCNGRIIASKSWMSRRKHPIVG